MTRIIALIALFLLLLPAMAQDSTTTASEAEAEKSYFTALLEDQLSTPDRKIRISGISGALSSSATIGEITVADREGVWLRLVQVSIDWSRSALLLRQRLEVQKLAAERIDFPRKPQSGDALPSPESRGFSLPELPLAVNLEQLEVERAVFGADVFGLESELSLKGALQLEKGTLNTTFEINRLDGPGGEFALKAAYSNATEVLDLDLVLDEPENGVVANLLKAEGRPPLKLTVSGSGPVSNLDVKLALQADGVPTFGGTAQFRRRAEGLDISTRLAGPIARLLPAQFRDFFGPGTRLTANGLAREEGGFLLENLFIKSTALTVEAAAETAQDGFLTALSLNAAIGDPDGKSVVLPVAGGETRVQSASLNLTFGEAGSERWHGLLSLEKLETGTFAAGKSLVEMGGEAKNLASPEQRRVSFDVKGSATEIIAERADVAEALGNMLSLSSKGEWQAGDPVTLEDLTLAGHSFSLSAKGVIEALAFDGTIQAEAASLSPFSGMAGQELGGALRLSASGRGEPLTGSFDLTVDGAAQDLILEQETAARLLAGTTTIRGGIARGPEGLAARGLLLENNQLTLAADGTFATGAAAFKVDSTINDISVLSPRASGRLTASARASGDQGRIGIALLAEVPNGSLSERVLRDASLAFDGQLEAGALVGQLVGDGFLGGERVALTTNLLTDQSRQHLSELRFQTAGTELTGDLQRGRDGLFQGSLRIDARDIATAAALFLQDGQGGFRAALELAPDGNGQAANVKAQLQDLRLNEIRIASGEISASGKDLFGVPTLSGTVDATTIEAANLAFRRIVAKADSEGEATRFDANAILEEGAELAVAGTLAPRESGYRVGLEALTLSKGPVSARLLERTAVDIAGDKVTLQPLQLDIGGGRLEADGTIDENLSLNLLLRDLPLSVANAVQPDLSLGGTLNGTARIEGTRDAPAVTFLLNGRAVTAAALQNAGLSTLSIDAKGTSNANRLTLDGNVTSPEGLRAQARGSVPLGTGNLDLDIELGALPLSIANRALAGEQLGGRLTGSARVTGTVAAPVADFNLGVESFSARALSEAGLGPLAVQADGSYRDEAVLLRSLNARGASGLAINASGRAPLAGPGLDLRVDGSAPLSIASRFLIDRGTQLSGTATMNARIGGSASAPVINGTVATSGATAVDPITNLRLNDIRVMAAIDGNRIVLQESSARLAAGGRISLAGSIMTEAASGFPADLRIRLEEARYSDGELVTATVSGDLALTGALTRDPLLRGAIDVARAEILVPDNLGGSAASLDISHIAPPPAVQRTLERARANDGTPVPNARPSVMQLDVDVRAPARIFVRGRGLDAELGGSLRIKGPVTSVQPVGAFSLIRGRLSIIGQRITFDEGRITLVGDLDPQLDFIARSQGNDITVFIRVSGRVSDLDISFSSQPELPEDEVLARLIFNRGIDELSPLQIAQLAAAAAELAGGGNTSLLGSLRQATGLDDLDVITDSEGNAAVRAGRYIQDNIYLGVEAGAAGTTQGTINLDISENLKARGTIGSDGESGVGLFFEKDY